MFKTLVAAAAIVALPLAAYLGWAGVAAAGQGYDWSQMDWNADGRTSPDEFLAAADIGSRAVCKDGKTCTEFYDLKADRVLRTDCE